MSRYEKIKNEALQANLEIPKQKLAIFTWGNASAFDKSEGVFAIKPSGVPYSELTLQKIVVVDLDGNVVEGKLNPSSDTPTHAFLYKEFSLNMKCDVFGIVHTHSTFATSWAQALKDVPVFGTTHADHIQRSIPCTPYLSKESVQNEYEKETGKLIVDYLNNRSLSPELVNMILVGGHGPFCWGNSAKEAVYTAKTLEEICQMALYTKMIDYSASELPEYIIQKHYQRKHGKNAYYGQR